MPDHLPGRPHDHRRDRRPDPGEPPRSAARPADEGVGSWLRRRAERSGDRTALLTEETSLTYAELHDRAVRLAHLLEGDGVRAGDRVAHLGPNRPCFLESLFAVSLLGAVFVPLNTLLSGPELDHQLADCGARTLLRSASVPPPALRHGVPVREVGGPDHESALAAASAAPLTRGAADDDPCLVLYTSGTTGRPKGAVLTHRNVLANCLNVLLDLDLTGAETALVTAPLFHAAALNMLALPVLMKGGACLLAASFDAGRTLERIARHRVTSMFAVPTMLERMAGHPDWASSDLASLRTLLCGGAPVPAELKARFAERGITVREGYGLTEAAPGVLVDGGGALVPHLLTDVRLAPLPGAPDGTGELLVSGPNVMSGYWNRPEDTAAAFDRGWLRTGDIARREPDGSLRVVDRLKEVIISGGENIYPAEVERALLLHPGVAECAVIGVPDARWGEVGRALLVPAPDATLDPDAVLTALAGRLARYKIPRTALVVPDLPRTRTGKVHRTELKSRYGVVPP